MPQLNFPAPGSLDAKRHLTTFGGIDLVPSGNYSYTNLVNYSENFLHPSWFRTANNAIINRNYDFLDVYLNDNDIITETAFKLDKNYSDSGFLLTTTANNVVFGQNISVTADTNYVLSFYAKTYTVANCFYRVLDVTNQSNIVNSTNYSDNSSTQWNRVSVAFTTPNNCSQITAILLDSVPSGSIGSIALSNPQLELGNVASVYKPTISLVDSDNTGQFTSNATKSITGNLGSYSDTTYNWDPILPVTGVSTIKYATANFYLDDEDVLRKTVTSSANVTLYFSQQNNPIYFAGDIIRLRDNITGNVGLYSVIRSDLSSLSITTANVINDSSLTISSTTSPVYTQSKLFSDYSRRSVLLESSNIRKNYYLTEFLRADRQTRVNFQTLVFRGLTTEALPKANFLQRSYTILRPDSVTDRLKPGRVRSSIVVKPIVSQTKLNYINPIKFMARQPIGQATVVNNILKIKYPALTSYQPASTLGAVGKAKLADLKGTRETLRSGTLVPNKVRLNDISFTVSGRKFPKLTQFLRLRSGDTLPRSTNRIESNTTSITANTITSLSSSPKKNSYTPSERYLLTFAGHLNPLRTSAGIIKDIPGDRLKSFSGRLSPKFSFLDIGKTLPISSTTGISSVPANALKPLFPYRDSFRDVSNTNLKTVSLLRKYNNEGPVYPTMSVIGFSDVQNNLVATYTDDSDILRLTVSNTAPTQSITVNPTVAIQSPAAYFDGYTKLVDTSASGMLAFGPTGTIELMMMPIKTNRLQVVTSFNTAETYSYITCSGGNIANIGEYKVHTFTSSGFFTVPSNAVNLSVEVFLVAGGGGGGGSLGGGGGGGGVIYLTSARLTSIGEYPIIIGAGGNGNNNAAGSEGGNSTAFGAVAFGGGGGGIHPGIQSGRAGGSGGGGAAAPGSSSVPPGPALGGIVGVNNVGITYGNRGGNQTVGRAPPFDGATRGSGGGGAGGAGFDTNVTTLGDTGQTGSGAGGPGLAFGFTGINYYYAAGGGGGAFTGQNGGWGGLGGGGAGSGNGGGAPGGQGGINPGGTSTITSVNGAAGGVNTGGGGGGGAWSLATGGNGGSGIVMIRYKSQPNFAALRYALETPSSLLVSPSTFGGRAGSLFTITNTGASFTADAVVRFIDNSGIEYASNSVTYVNASQITATTPRNFTVIQEPLGIKVIQSSGTFTQLDCIDCGVLPIWQTATGQIGTVEANSSASVSVVATDPDAGSFIRYSLISGSLPLNLILSNLGVISGTVSSSYLSQTTVNFSIRATDDVGNFSDRDFNLLVVPAGPYWSTPSGQIGTNTARTGTFSATVAATTPIGTITGYSVAGGSLPPGLSINSSGLISGTITAGSAIQTYNFTLRVTNSLNNTADRAFNIVVIGNTISVVYANYLSGCSDSTGGNRFSQFQTVCNGQQTCNFNPLDYGDPQGGTPKNFSIRWSCTAGQNNYECVGSEAGYTRSYSCAN